MQTNKTPIFFSDQPIKTIEEDKEGLNRNNFAKNLAKNIENYFKNNSNSLTIGLIGDWGCGKTSLINLTKLHLKENESIKIMDFNPWIYSSYNQLIEQFFDEIINQFSKNDDNELIANLKSYISKINKNNLIKSALPIIASLASPEIGKILDENLKMDSEEKTLEKIKDNINQELINHKIVCIVDDIDRLNSNEISEMFKLIKIMANFDNIIYIVSFDENIISKALEKNYDQKFIEKIINVPLYVPSVTTEELNELLLKDLNRLSKQYGIPFNENRLNKFLNYYTGALENKSGIINFFRTIRDVKRFINIFEFNLELIKDEINFVDFFAITAIQVFHLDIYEKIKYNEYLLTDYHYYEGYTISKDSLIKSKIENFERLFDDENLAAILKKLFPMMSYIYNTNRYSYDYHNYDEELRVCHPNHFKSYFKLNDTVKDISEKEVNEIINLINSEKSVKTIFNQLKDMGTKKIGLFLRYMENRLKRINNTEYFIKILFKIDTEISTEVYMNFKAEIKDLIINLLHKIDKQKRFTLLNHNFKESNNIDLMYDIIKFFENNEFKSNEELLSMEQIENLKDCIKEKFKKVDINSFNDEYTYKKILIIGEDLNLINNQLIEDLISTENALMKFLKFFLSEREDSPFLIRNMNEISEYVDLNVIYNKIEIFTPDLKESQIVKNFLKGYETLEKSKSK